MIYVISDVFGRIDAFHNILRQIDLKDDDTLYVLGNVIDGDQKGIEIIEEIMESKNIKLLLGNHEYMMMKVINNLYGVWPPVCLDGKDAALWAYNGGKETIKDLTLLPREESSKLFDFLNSCQYEETVVINGKKYVLTNSTPKSFYKAWLTKEGESLQNNAVYSCDKDFAVWHRLKDGEIPNNCIVVHGHTCVWDYDEEKKSVVYKKMHPDQEPEEEDEEMKESQSANEFLPSVRIKGKDIAINCGGYKMSGRQLPGRLACLCLDTMEEFYA